MKRKLTIAVVVITLFACNNASKNETSMQDSATITGDTTTKVNADTTSKKTVVVVPVNRNVKKKAVSTKPKSSTASKQKMKSVTRNSKKTKTNK